MGTTTTYKEYLESKTAFFQKHNYDYKLNTSGMDEYGRYYKDYIFEDGATWYEAMTPTYEKETVTIRRVQVEVEVKMLRTEYWSNDHASKYYYEKF